MWDSTVHAERERFVAAPPENVWVLAGSPAALSLSPVWWAFSVPDAVEGTDRLCCLLVSGPGGFRRPVVDTRRFRCAVVDVREEVPGQSITWQVRSTDPVGKQFFTLSVRPQPGGSLVRVAVSAVVRRNMEAEGEPYWHRHVKAWLGGLRDVAEGRAQCPQAEMPAEVRRALAAPAPLGKPVEASAAVVINAAPADVWEVVRDPGVSPESEPGRRAWQGRVPGTPRQGTGEMRCVVHRHPGGRFTAYVEVVTELADERREVTRQVGPPGYEGVCSIAPVPGGTRLELTVRWPARAARGHASVPETPERVRTALKKHAEDYQALIERALGGGESGAAGRQGLPEATPPARGTDHPARRGAAHSPSQAVHHA
jgi:hypothetical protein